MTNTYPNILELIQEIKEETSPPIVEAHLYPFPSYFIVPVSKLTKNVFDGKYNDGKKHPFNPIGHKGTDQETRVWLSGLDDDRRLQAFDLVLYTALVSLLVGLPPETKYPVFLSCSRIYKMVAMRENVRLPPTAEAEIMRRLDVMLHIQLTLEPSEKLRTACKEFIFNENLLCGYLATGQYPSGAKASGIMLEKQPVLYRADSILRQISTIPLNYTLASARLNKVYILVKLYLTKRIEWLKSSKRGKNKMKQPIILIDSVKEALGELADTIIRRTLIQLITKILASMVSSGYIKNFEKQTGQDNRYRAVIIHL